MDRTAELIRRSQDGDKEARETLIQENMGLVHHVVRRFLGRGAEAEDLTQIGAIGLMKAIERFDLSYEVRFSTYAVPMIAGEIRRFLRDDSIIKVSRSLKELAVRAARLREELLMEQGGEPGLEELAARLRVEPEELAQAYDSCSEVESLHKIIYQGDGEGVSLMDRVEEKKDPGGRGAGDDPGASVQTGKKDSYGSEKAGRIEKNMEKSQKTVKKT